MTKLMNAALVFLAAGIFTSVTILSGYQILFAIPLIYYTYLAIKNKEINLPKSAWWLIGFSIAGALSLIVNIDIIERPFRHFSRIKYFLFGVGGIFVYRVWLKEASDMAKKNLLRLFFVSIIVAGLYATWEVFFSGKGRAETLTDTMRYGYGSAMVLLMLLSALLHREKLKSILDARLGLIAFIIGFIGMYLTYTRGAMLGFLCGLPFVLFFYKKKLGYYLGGTAVLGVIFLGCIYLFGSGNYGSRFLVSKDNGSDNIRRVQWQTAFIAFKEKPVLGYGMENYFSQQKRIKTDYNLVSPEHSAYNYNGHSHNIYLEVLSGTGVIGFIFFMGWLITWAIEMFKAGGLTRAIVIPLGVAFSISSFFEVTFDANNSAMIFAVYAISLARYKK